MATKKQDAFEGLDYANLVEVAALVRGQAHAPTTAQERWAQRGLMALAGACDGAKEDDGVGFNKGDTNAGRYLGHFVGEGGCLDDVEWQAAIDMLGKYHGQIGRRPVADALDTARLTALEATVEGTGCDFKGRLMEVHTEAKRRQKARKNREKRLANPTVTLEREGLLWVVTTPYNIDATEDWRTLHKEHGGRWDRDRKVRLVPYKASRALNTLLETHYKGEAACGPKGAYFIGVVEPVAPVAVAEDDEDEGGEGEDEDEGGEGEDVYEYAGFKFHVVKDASGNVSDMAAVEGQHKAAYADRHRRNALQSYQDNEGEDDGVGGVVGIRFQQPEGEPLIMPPGSYAMECVSVHIDPVARAFVVQVSTPERLPETHAEAIEVLCAETSSDVQLAAAMHILNS
jgi:hypothetical protein